MIAGALYCYRDLQGLRAGTLKTYTRLPKMTAWYFGNWLHCFLISSGSLLEVLRVKTLPMQDTYMVSLVLWGQEAGFSFCYFLRYALCKFLLDAKLSASLSKMQDRWRMSTSCPFADCWTCLTCRCANTWIDTAGMLRAFHSLSQGNLYGRIMVGSCSDHGMHARIMVKSWLQKISCVFLEFFVAGAVFGVGGWLLLLRAMQMTFMCCDYQTWMTFHVATIKLQCRSSSVFCIP